MTPLQQSWQLGWLGIKPDDPMPMNRQERESMERTIKSQVLAELAKNSPADGAKETDPGAVNEIRKLLAYLKVPSVLHRPTIRLVAIGTLLTILYAAWHPISATISSGYYRIPFVSQIQKLDDEMNDTKTGLPAIVGTLDKSQKQLANVTTFLVAKFPEFSTLVVSDARKAAEEGNISQALTLLKVADVGLQDANAQKTMASPDFFSSATHGLSNIPLAESNPELRSQIHDVRVTLAAYSSSLRPVPVLTTHGKPIKSAFLIAHLTLDLTHGGTEAIVNVSPPGKLALTVFDVNVLKGSQMLDGTVWDHVTFVGTAIRYYGGPVKLTDVRFINCIFITPPVPTSAQFLEYATLGLEKLTINAGLSSLPHRGLFVLLPPRPTISLNRRIPGRSVVCTVRGIGGTSEG